MLIDSMKRCGCQQFTPVLTRREMLRVSAAGFGYLALASLLGETSVEASDSGVNPLAAKPPHFPPRAKRVIFLFMHGGPSHVDTFDYKPLLERDDGKPLPFAKPRVSLAQTGNLLKSPWKFQQHGQSGSVGQRTVPARRQLRRRPVLHQVDARHRTRGTAARCSKLHTGSDTFVRPSMGSWVTYGLGTENREPARLHHHLPDARARRREQLELGVPARGLSGHAARQRQHRRRTRP